MLSHINRIDIEFHSKCNRTCEWCPNSFIDRISEDKILDKDIYIKLLNDLKDNNFGTLEYNTNSKGPIISFLGYQDPMLQPDLLKEYVNIAREIFKDVDVDFITNTNGDLLTPDKLVDLHLSQLNIMDYDCKGRDWWKKQLKECKALKIKETDRIMQFVHAYINLIQVIPNWPEIYLLENRGGSLDPSKLSQNLKWKENAERREKRCIESIFYLNVYHNGDVTPCCHIRPDNPDHKDYILGNLHEKSIVDIFYGEKASYFRSIMGHSYNKDKFFEPCKNCHKYRSQHSFAMIFEENGVRYPYIELIYIDCIEDKEFDTYIKTMENWSNPQIELLNSFKPSMQFDKENFKELYENHCTNIRTLSSYYEYTYIDQTKYSTYGNYDNSDLIDDLSNSYINLSGFYLPFFGLSKMNKEKIFLFEGRKRYESIRYMANKKYYSDKEILCLSIDCHKESFNDYLLFPKEILNKLEGLNLEYSEYNDRYVKIQTSDPVNIFLILHILQEEITDKLKNNYDDIKDSVQPHPFINISKIGGVNLE